MGSQCKTCAGALARAVFGLLVLSWPADAEPLQPPLAADLTLRRLIDDSFAARPELARAQAEVRAQGERVPQAGAFPDPVLQVGIQNDGFTSLEIGREPTSFVSLMVAQTVPWPGKLSLSQQLAQLGAEQASLAVVRVQLSTEAEVRRAYLELVLTRDRLQLLDQLDAIWEQSFATARARYEAGDAAQSDVLRAQLERNRLKQRRFALQAEERTRVQRLNRLRDHPLDEPIETSTHVRELPSLAPLAARFDAATALALSPELAAARLGITRADTAVALADRGYYPDLRLGVGVMIRGTTLPPMWLVTVAAPLPVFAGSKQRRAVAENRAWSSAAERAVTALEQQLRLRTAERRAAFSALVQTIELYEQGLLVQSQATTESTLSQYKVGRLTFASVLEANAGLIADQEGYLQAIAAAHRVLIAEAEVTLSAVELPQIPVVSMDATGGSEM